MRFVTTPLQTFMIYMFFAIVFTAMAYLMGQKILYALGGLAFVWGFVAAFIVNRVRK